MSVTIKANKEGKVIVVGKNPEFGTFMVQSEEVTFNEGFVSKSTRVAFVRGKIEVLESLGLKDNGKLSGKIIRQESFEPFYPNQAPKINPSTGEKILKNGREVYMNSVYTVDMNAQDAWINNQSLQVEKPVEDEIADQAI